MQMNTLDIISKGVQYVLYFSCYETPSRAPVAVARRLLDSLSVSWLNLWHAISCCTLCKVTHCLAPQKVKYFHMHCDRMAAFASITMNKMYTSNPANRMAASLQGPTSLEKL